MGTVLNYEKVFTLGDDSWWHDELRELELCNAKMRDKLRLSPNTREVKLKVSNQEPPTAPFIKLELHRGPWYSSVYVGDRFMTLTGGVIVWLKARFVEGEDCYLQWEELA